MRLYNETHNESLRFVMIIFITLQASQSESRLEEAEGQLCQLTQLHAAQELDILASSALNPVLKAAQATAARLEVNLATSFTRIKHGSPIYPSHSKKRTKSLILIVLLFLSIDK